MENNEEWNSIIQEEVENMVCRLRERGIDADRFEITVKGQRAETVDDTDDCDEYDTESIGQDDIEAILRDIQNRNKNLKEKYIPCSKCGERILESKIKTYESEKLCDSCYNKVQSKKSNAKEFFNGEIVTANEGFALFLQSLLDIAQSQNQQKDTTERKKKGESKDENKD